MKTKALIAGLIATIVVFVLVYGFLSIFDQQLTRKWGFNTTIHLKAGNKFVGYDWLDDNVWTARREMRPGEFPETIVIEEHSRFGQLEGTITVIESAAK